MYSDTTSYEIIRIDPMNVFKKKEKKATNPTHLGKSKYIPTQIT